MKTSLQKFFLLFFVSALYTNIVSAQLTVSLTVSTYNGYNVSCTGGTNGSITANPSGGTSPYTYQWSNAAATTTQTITGIQASYYVVTVTDASHNTATAGVTLREPPAVSVSLTSSTYSNGYNVSCYQCYNGSITNTPSGGVGSYTYLWNGGATTQNRSSVGGGTYQVTVTDANGCSKAGPILLTEAPKDTWTMEGNTGSNPATQYIGTADNADLVFRTHAAERIRVAGSGNVGIGTNNPTAALDVNGSAKFGPISVNGTATVSDLLVNAGNLTLANLAVTGDPCTVFLTLGQNNQVTVFNQANCTGSYLPFWSTIGNTLPNNNADQFIGTISQHDFRIRTSNIERMIVKADGSIRVEDNPIYLHGSGDNNHGLAYDGFSSSLQTVDGPVLFGWSGGALGSTNGGQKIALAWNQDGKVSIGATPYFNNDYKLAVDGTVLATEFLVKLRNAWPDYVFAKDYKLRNLDKLEEYIKVNKHLPEIPSEVNVGKEGLSLGEVVSKQMEKIEELTLYIIQLKHELDDLKKESENAKSSVK